MCYTVSPFATECCSLFGAISVLAVTDTAITLWYKLLISFSNDCNLQINVYFLN